MESKTIEKIIIWLVVIGIVAIIGIGIAIYLLPNPPSTTPNPIGGSTEPTNTGGTGGSTSDGNNGGGGTTEPTQGTGGTASRTIPIATSNGSTVVVKDFKSDPETQHSTASPSQYILAGGTMPTPDTAAYSIFYLDSNQSFNVTLLREPINSIRVQAEQELMTKLDISQGQMCALKYSVGVPSWVNSFYSGKNLGFSFCPGATKL